MIARDITRGHRNKMRRDAEFIAYGSDSSGAKKVDFNGRVKRRVKTHRCGGMNDGVATSEHRTTGIVETKAVATHIAGDRRNAASGHPRKALFAEFGTQTIEGVVLQNLASHALFNGGTPTWTHQQHDLAIGH